MKRRIGILGATGSIGTQALDVISRHRDKFEVVFLTAHRNYEKLFSLARQFGVRMVGFSDESVDVSTDEFRIFKGIDGLVELVDTTGVDRILVATTGIVGIFPTLKAIEDGIDIALANKETLVSFGKFVMEELKKSKSLLIPVDSEHSAIFQLLEGRRKELRRIILTASGGPFRNWTLEEMGRAAPQDALRHPTWNMGRKITIDSATMMNKALEIIEAYWLFGTKDIDVVIHPGSIVHSFVQLRDGSLLAHVGFPDMRLPIAYGLSYPERLENVGKETHPYDLPPLEFHKPDFERFPALRLAYEVLEKMEWYPAAMNAANEEAVYMFLDGKIGFLDIVRLVEETLRIMEREGVKALTLRDYLKVDERARRIVRELVERQSL